MMHTQRDFRVESAVSLTSVHFTCEKNYGERTEEKSQEKRNNSEKERYVSRP